MIDRKHKIIDRDLVRDRAAQLQNERDVLLDERTTFQDECNEKMRMLHMKEQKLEERTTLLEQNVEEFRENVVALDAREQQILARETAVEQIEQTREEERMSLENAKANIEAREHNLAQSIHELDTERQR